MRILFAHSDTHKLIQYIKKFNNIGKIGIIIGYYRELDGISTKKVYLSIQDMVSYQESRR